MDSQAGISESDIRQAGLAITKRAYSIFESRAYEAVLIIAALRGTYHMTELTGAKLIMSIHPKYQKALLSTDIPCKERINVEIAPDVIKSLSLIPEFVRAYEPEGMTVKEFISYGPTQRTLTQFSEIGW